MNQRKQKEESLEIELEIQRLSERETVAREQLEKKWVLS
jgi:hypothetical protein